MNQELKNLVSAIVDLGKLVAMVVEKKGLDASELDPLKTLALEIQPAISGAGVAMNQLKALDLAGEADLASFLVAKLALADPKAANILTKALQAALADIELVKAIKG